MRDLMRVMRRKKRGDFTKEVKPKDFKESILHLCEQYLKTEKGLTDKERMKVYQVFAHLKIMLKDF